MSLTTLFDKPKVIAVVGDVNQGKSMLLYHILDTLGKHSSFSLYTYGLRLEYKDSLQVFSVAELESIKNSIIIVDELSSLFDLDNRKVKKIIENTLRLIHHNNNVLVICGTPENFKKFLSAKVSVAFYKQSTISDFINGSKLKRTLTDYKGNERGSEILSLDKGQALVFDGGHYKVIDIPYIKEYDTKRDNQAILQPLVKKGGKKKA